MNKQKILASLMAIGISFSILMSNNIDVSASKITFDSNGNNRPITGKFNADTKVLKNPTFPTSFSGDSSDSYSVGGQELISHKWSAYGYDILSYVPKNYDKYLKVIGGNIYSKYTVDPPGLPYRDEGASCNLGKYTMDPNYIGTYANDPNGNYRRNLDAKRKAQEGEWRYIGYNQEGELVENPFFPVDSPVDGIHKSDLHKVYQGYGSGGAGTTIPKSLYDGVGWKSDKIAAITRLMATNSRWGTLAIYKDGRYSSKTMTAADYCDYFSLTTHPVNETPIFKMSNKTRGGSYYDTMPSPTVAKDIILTSLVVKNKNGTTVGTFTRDINTDVWSTSTNGKLTAGEVYNVEYKIYNSSTTALPFVSLDWTTAIDSYAEKNDFNDKFGFKAGGIQTFSVNNIGAKSYFTGKTSFKVPDNATKKVRLTSLVSDVHTALGHNMVTTNDFGKIIWDVNPSATTKAGDLKVVDLKMYDINGNVVDSDEMIPTKAYKVVANYEYTGDTISFYEYVNTPITDPDTGKTGNNTELRLVEKEFKFGLSSSRYTPNGNDNVIASSTKNLSSIEKGTKFSLETDYSIYEYPKSEARATVSTNSNVKIANSPKTASWDRRSDFSISNVVINPNNVRPIQDGDVYVSLKYTLNFTCEGDSYNELTKITYNVNGTEVNAMNTIKKGDNTITEVLKIPVKAIASGTKEIPIKITVNKNKVNYEINYNNNSDDTKFVYYAPYNPTTLKGCPTGTATSNKWNVTHSKYTYDTFRSSYLFSSGLKTNKYVNSPDVTRTSLATKEYEESYKVTKVEFKSKATIDNGDNWVDITNITSNNSKAVVKAGYGYDLRITVEYNSNLSQQPSKSYTDYLDKISGVEYSKLQSPAFINNDIYLLTSDNVVVSATGIYGTTSVFSTPTVTTENGKVKTVYTTKTKIPVGINTKDGTYSIKVFTPAITGIGTHDGKNSDLCDYKTTLFTVKGSMYDDIEDGIIQ